MDADDDDMVILSLYKSKALEWTSKTKQFASNGVHFDQ